MEGWSVYFLYTLNIYLDHFQLQSASVAIDKPPITKMIKTTLSALGVRTKIGSYNQGLGAKINDLAKCALNWLF